MNNEASYITYFSFAAKCVLNFYVLLTVHPGMILVNKQLDAQFFMYVYFYSLQLSETCRVLFQI